MPASMAGILFGPVPPPATVVMTPFCAKAEELARAKSSEQQAKQRPLLATPTQSRPQREPRLPRKLKSLLGWTSSFLRTYTAAPLGAKNPFGPNTFVCYRAAIRSAAQQKA